MMYPDEIGPGRKPCSGAKGRQAADRLYLNCFQKPCGDCAPFFLCLPLSAYIRVFSLLFFCFLVVSIVSILSAMCVCRYGLHVFFFPAHNIVSSISRHLLPNSPSHHLMFTLKQHESKHHSIKFIQRLHKSILPGC